MRVVVNIPALIFWSSLILLAYVYVGYPVIAWLRGHLRARPVVREAIEPLVTVIVVAHNEAHRIARRIENLLSSDYPRERLRIVIASDGSTDDTIERARPFERTGVVLYSFRERRGKAAVLNELIPSAEGEIVVLADARQRFEPSAIRTLVANFADPGVGAVSGELHLRKRKGTTPRGEGVGFYWKYEKFIRANESWSGSTVGATGAIYAIRRDLFEPIPEDTVLDDVLIPARIVRRGYRVLFEAAARAHDLISGSPREDFVRKTRTIAGTFQLFAREPWLVNPLRSAIWFEALSHKALRLVVPALHIAIFASNLALIDLWSYRWAMGGQMMFYTAALVGHMLANTQRRSMIITVPYTMTLLGWATIVGFARFVTRRQRVTWERIPGTPLARAATRVS
jgi:cellulose synthase/poly-beta-1,6-N-acetylglucosamine synthase-like glycosyltransferase